jgi:hypothetical protein
MLHANDFSQARLLANAAGFLGLWLIHISPFQNKIKKSQETRSGFSWLAAQGLLAWTRFTI